MTVTEIDARIEELVAKETILSDGPESFRTRRDLILVSAEIGFLIMEKRRMQGEW